MGTYVLEINLERKFLPHLAFVSALAIHDTIEKFILDVDGQILQLKWPIDLILNKFKCGGILIENKSSKIPINAMGKQINGIRFFDDIPSKYKYIQLEKTVKKANIIPKPLGFGLVCMLLRFGISINFSKWVWDIP